MGRAEPQIGLFIKPMLCGRSKSLSDLSTKAAGPCIAQMKYDGERIQVHIDMTTPWHVRIFSRSSRDSTYERSSIVPYIEQAIHADAGACILDGEIVTYNSYRQCIEPFGSVQGMAPHLYVSNHLYAC